MQLYHEYALTPKARSGTMIPKSSLVDVFSRPDSGYCTVYAFDKFATEVIRAQGNSQGMGRFPVYADRLWIDIDRDSEDEAKVYAREVAKLLRAADYSFSVWVSGGKGYHLCIKTAPMFGHDVPHSHKCFIESLNIACDLTLYQHGRLLSNPGRVHPKTSIKKHKVMEHAGSKLPDIALVKAPERVLIDKDSLTNNDLVRLVYSRLGSVILDAPLPGNRHTTIWSTAMMMFEAGMSSELVLQNLLFINSCLPNPKKSEEICQAVNQARVQSGMLMSQTP